MVGRLERTKAGADLPRKGELQRKTPMGMKLE